MLRNNFDNLLNGGHVSNKLENTIRQIASYAVLIATVLALAALLGWLGNIDVLTHPFFGSQTMKANSAVGVLFLCLGLTGAIQWSKTPNIRIICAVIAGSIALISLLECIHLVAFPFDELLVHDRLGSLGPPGRMAPATALALLLIALALLTWYKKSGVYFMTGAAIIAFIAVLGYIGYLPLMYGSFHQMQHHWPVFTSLAFNTTICLLCLSVAGLASMPHSRLRATLLADDSGGLFARYAIPSVIGVPFLATFLASGGALVGLYPESTIANVSFVTTILIAVAAFAFISEQLSKLNEKVLAKEQVRADIIYALAHDLKVPLLGSQRLLSLMVDGAIGSLSRQQHDLLAKLQNSQREMLCMVDDFIFEYQSEKQPDQPTVEMIDASKLIEPSIEKFKDWSCSEGKTLTFHLENDLALVRCDVTAIRRLTDNLIHNALKYTPVGGDISVRLKSNDNDLIIEVEDSGAGISLDDQSHIFKRFWQTEQSRDSHRYSNGLGLFICKQIAEMHCGNIVCNSKEGSGTRFIVTLPNAHIGQILPNN